MKIILSKAGKMPCHSYSLPAEACKTGSKLAKVDGSVCANCYAKKGMYRFKNVKRVREQNLDSLPVSGGSWEEWITAMASHLLSSGESYFRWFDSGDIQSVEMLAAITEVAKRTPAIKHWLPTHEVGIVRRFLAGSGGFPDNLRVRVSAAMVNGEPTRSYKFTSTVRTLESLQRGTTEFVCPSRNQGNSCGACRACWSEIPRVAYVYH